MWYQPMLWDKTVEISRNGVVSVSALVSEVDEILTVAGVPVDLAGLEELERDCDA